MSETNKSTKKLGKYAPRGQGSETKRVAARLSGFDYKHSRAYRALRKKFSSSVTHSELKSIAQVICLHTGLKLDRDAARDNKVLIKWFEENWKTVHDNLCYVSMLDDQNEMIDSTRDDNS